MAIGSIIKGTIKVVKIVTTVAGAIGTLTTLAGGDKSPDTKKRK